MQVPILTVFCTACVIVENTPLLWTAALWLFDSTGSDESSSPSCLFISPSCSSSSSCASSPTEVLWRRRASPAFTLTEVRLWPARTHAYILTQEQKRELVLTARVTRGCRRTHWRCGTAQERFSPGTPASPAFIYFLMWSLSTHKDKHKHI